MIVLVVQKFIFQELLQIEIVTKKGRKLNTSNIIRVVLARIFHIYFVPAIILLRIYSIKIQDCSTLTMNPFLLKDQI